MVVSPATAATTDDPGTPFPDLPEDPTAQNAEDALAEDVALAAESEEISFDEAWDLYSWQNDFNSLTTHFDPAAFTSFELARDRSPRHVIASFPGPADTSILSTILALGLDVEVIANTGVSREDVLQQLTATGAALRSLDLEIAMMTDVRGRFDIVIDTEPGIVEHLAATLDVLKASNISSVSAGDVKHSTDTRRGGSFMSNHSGDSNSSCTSAFAAWDVSNGYQLMTAGHCMDDDPVLWFWNSSLSSGTSLSRTDWTTGNIIDGAIFDHPNIRDDFHYTAGCCSYRDQTGYATPNAGTQLRFFGRETNHSSGDDVNAYVQCFPCSHGNQDWSAITDSITATGGDSGGPWFWSGTAYGVFTGRNWDYASPGGAFSPVIYFDSVWGRNVYVIS